MKIVKRREEGDKLLSPERGSYKCLAWSPRLPAHGSVAHLFLRIPVDSSLSVSPYSSLMIVFSISFAFSGSFVCVSRVEYPYFNSKFPTRKTVSELGFLRFFLSFDFCVLFLPRAILLYVLYWSCICVSSSALCDGHGQIRFWLYALFWLYVVSLINESFCPPSHDFFFLLFF